MATSVSQEDGTISEHEGSPQTPAEVGVLQLFQAHYRPLVKLAWLLLHDRELAEETVQDAFVKVQIGWQRIRDPNEAPAYLRSAVLNGARSRLRRHQVARRHLGDSARDADSPEACAMANDERRTVIEAIRSLPTRQREAVLLRYYLDLSEAEIAAALGISRGSVSTHLHRGLATLREKMETPE